MESVDVIILHGYENGDPVCVIIDKILYFGFHDGKNDDSAPFMDMANSFINFGDHDCYFQESFGDLLSMLIPDSHVLTVDDGDDSQYPFGNN